VGASFSLGVARETDGSIDARVALLEALVGAGYLSELFEVLDGRLAQVARKKGVTTVVWRGQPSYVESRVAPWQAERGGSISHESCAQLMLETDLYLPTKRLTPKRLSLPGTRLDGLRVDTLERGLVRLRAARQAVAEDPTPGSEDALAAGSALRETLVCALHRGFAVQMFW
jgi:hypothetical protein